MIQNIKGTKDILPSEVRAWQRLEDVVRNTTRLYNYEEIRTPVLESSELFSRSAGEGSDVVSKEMYSFPDRSGDMLCLRPELTASVARAVLQYNLIRAFPTLRLWYNGPCFRYERPQLGRQRQFHQFGAECIGSAKPEADAEVIAMAYDIIKACGVSTFSLEINSLGSSDSRSRFREALVSYFSAHRDKLSEDSRRRLEINPLRILDSKDESDKSLLVNAPSLEEYLDQESQNHFSELSSMLSACSIPFTVNRSLVRGLDYYTDTVFEFKTTQLGAQDAIGGGGRYNNLFEQLSGPQIPGVGFGIGIERLILLSKSEADSVSSLSVCLVYDPQFNAQAIALSHSLRKSNIDCRVDVQRRSFKAQMKDADKFGARLVLILGENEIKSNSIIIKDMSTGNQEAVSFDDNLNNLIVKHLDTLLNK